VKACDADNPEYHVCPFHPYRFGKGRPSVKTIRKFCLQCMGNSSQMVAECETEDCLCYPYRLGKNPERKGIGRTAEEMKAVTIKRMALSRKFPGKFERSWLPPGLTPPRGETENSGAKSFIPENSPHIDPGPGKQIPKNGP